MSQKLKIKFEKLAKTKKPVVEIIHEKNIHPDGTIHYNGKTLCVLRDAKTHERITYAIAKCNTMDNPTKKIGSDIAFGRALKKFFS